MSIVMLRVIYDRLADSFLAAHGGMGLLLRKVFKR